MNVSFGAPGWLWGLTLLPIFVYFLWPARRRGLTLTGDGAPPTVDPLGLISDLAPLVLRTSALALLLLALAGPRWLRVYEEPQLQGIGIALALDLSTSMWAEDMGARTSRLEVAKATALQFIDERSDDIGLVTFAGEAFARLPLTHDGFVVSQAVEELQVGLLTDGTDIAGAIAAGAGLLDDSPHGSKILILVTDGAHNKAGVMPDLAARAAAAVGVTIYPVAIGQERGRDQRAMETVLTQAARITGGRYFKATDATALASIYEEIDRLVQPSEETIERIESVPFAWLFALGALFASALAWAWRASPLGVLP